MGTRSSIAMEHADGSITSIYCHWDGYLEHNGKMLFEEYGQEKLIELLALGDISSLAPEIGVKHDFDRPPNGVVNSYGRDRDDDDVDALTHAGRTEWLVKNGQEYNYLLDKDGVWQLSDSGLRHSHLLEKDGVWQLSGSESDSELRHLFTPLQTALEKENLIRADAVLNAEKLVIRYDLATKDVPMGPRVRV